MPVGLAADHDHRAGINRGRRRGSAIRGARIGDAKRLAVSALRVPPIGYVASFRSPSVPFARLWPTGSPPGAIPCRRTAIPPERRRGYAPTWRHAHSRPADIRARGAAARAAPAGRWRARYARACATRGTRLRRNAKGRTVPQPSAPVARMTCLSGRGRSSRRRTPRRRRRRRGTTRPRRRNASTRPRPRDRNAASA